MKALIEQLDHNTLVAISIVSFLFFTLLIIRADELITKLRNDVEELREQIRELKDG